MKQSLMLALVVVGLFGSGCGTVVKAGSPTPAPIPEPQSREASSDDQPASYDNKIKWTTASEVDNFGYEVYRSDSAEGPFEVLNQEVIEGAGTVDEPTAYEFVDDTIDPHKAYHYYVESISMSGVRERFTPIIRAKPKIPAAEPASDDDVSGGEASDGAGRDGAGRDGAGSRD